jgi:hypothetical protein
MLGAGVLAPAIAAVTYVMVRAMVVLPRLAGSRRSWAVPGDAFYALPAARYVANGAAFFMYEPHTVLYQDAAGLDAIGYPYPPGLPVLMSPVAWIGQTFGLTDNLMIPIPQPTLFRFWGPALALLMIVPLLLSVAYVLRDRVPVGRIVGAQWATAIAAVPALQYLHAEDPLACACLFASAGAAARGRWRLAGLLVAGAILFKQWAVFPALVVLAVAPAGGRRMVALYGFVVPALVMVPFMLSAPEMTFEAVTGTRASLVLGQHQIWAPALFGDAEFTSAQLPRLLWLGVALVIAFAVRGRPSLPVVVGAMGLVMVARILFEPTIFAYYLVPAFVFAILCAAVQGRPIALRAVLALTLGAWCGQHDVPVALWWVVLAVGMAYVCAPLYGAVRDTWRLSPRESARGRGSDPVLSPA